jgi:hypothetical protein
MAFTIQTLWRELLKVNISSQTIVKGEEGAVGSGGVVGCGGALDSAKGGSVVRRKEVLIRPECILRR